jgi:hypothetical protein
MNKVTFNPVSKLHELTVPPPKPSREYLPDWYKNMGGFLTKKPTFDNKGATNRTMKLCMPFADAITAGYIQETWQDIHISVEEYEDNESNLQYFYPTEPKIISTRSVSGYPIPEEFYPIEFVFHPAWSPQLPKGWSMLYTQPFNRPELVTHFLGGVVDSDSFTHSEQNANIPFFVKKSFNGIIPKGTPLVQMIPIRREEWESSTAEFNEDEQTKQTALLRQFFWGGYKKLHWQKKSYK